MAIASPSPSLVSPPVPVRLSRVDAPLILSIILGSYGAFWVGWSIVFIEEHRETSSFGDASYQDGKTLWLAQWGVLTACFAVIALRKNAATLTVLTLLAATFFMLSVNNAQQLQTTKRVAGYVGLATAVSAWYTAIAELVNEEWGRHILPGLDPFYKPQRTVIDKESIMSLLGYDRVTNTLFLQFRGLQITSRNHVYAIEDAISETIVDLNLPNNKCHVVADYEGTVIAPDVRREYWAMAAHLQKTYYLSATRFHVSSFGSKSHIAPMPDFSDNVYSYTPRRTYEDLPAEDETHETTESNRNQGDKNV